MSLGSTLRSRKELLETYSDGVYELQGVEKASSEWGPGGMCDTDRGTAMSRIHTLGPTGKLKVFPPGYNSEVPQRFPQGRVQVLTAFAENVYHSLFPWMFMAWRLLYMLTEAAPSEIS